jgi:hypothetical protein
MREYEWNIDKALTKGLAPEQLPINAEFLYQCLGFRCGKARLEAHVLLTDPVPVTVDKYYDWPFPQFLVGDAFHILVIRDTVNQQDSVYSISADHSTVTHIFDIHVPIYGKGSLMEVADFGEYLFMTNGVLMIIWDVALASWQAVPVSAIIPMMRTVCNLKGQAIGGGVLSNWPLANPQCDETFYLWSMIGFMNFTPEQNNEAGYRRCPYGGIVQHTKRMDDFVVGYSSKGIVFLMPVGEPVTTFGFKEVCDVGIINQGAMNGNLTRHIFVGEDFIIREVTKEGVKELGYQSYMEQLVGEDIIVSYDSHTKDFYIGNSTKTFLLSLYGMTEVQQHPSAVWRSNNGSYMLPETVDSRMPTITSEPIDMGYAGQKTIATIESDVAVVDGPEAGADYTNNNTLWGIATYKPINDQGIVALAVSGNAFRASLRFAEIYNNTRISYIKIRFKMTDLRGMRGVYAPPTSFRGQGA